MKRLLIFCILGSSSTVAHARFSNGFAVSNYSALFSTKVSGGNTIQVFAPLGLQIGYFLDIYYKSALFTDYNFLGSGKSILLQGGSLGYDYALYGGRNSIFEGQKETDIKPFFPRRVGLYSAIAFRNYNLSSISSPSEDPLSGRVPTKGRFLGLEAGMSFDQALSGIFRLNGRAGLLYPWFIQEEGQTGYMISLAAGISAVL